MNEDNAGGDGELGRIRAELAEIRGMLAQLSTQLSNAQFGSSSGTTSREVARMLVIAMLSIAVGVIYGWVLLNL